jgi:hypothetical protein
MAIHYYDEDTIEVGKPIGGKVVLIILLKSKTTKTRRNTKKKSQVIGIPMPIKENLFKPHYSKIMTPKPLLQKKSFRIK